jgi:hypothetical protein
MSGDANAGGGGSVYWTVDVDNADDTKTGDDNRGNGRHKQRGKDLDGAPGDDFTITLRVPQTFNSATDYVNFLQGGTAFTTLDPRHVQFTLPIEWITNDNVQINVHWGGQVSDTGRNKHGHATATLLATTAKKRSAKKASAKKPVAKKGKAKARGAKRR